MKKTINLNLLSRSYIVIIITSLLSSCSINLISKNKPDSGLEISETGCIQPNNSFSYEVRSKGPANENDAVFPGKGWHVISESPDSLEILGARHIKGKNEIWAVDSSNTVNGKKEFSVYNPEKNQWIEISKKSSEDIYVSDLYITQDGDLWGRNYSTLDNYPLLSRYNDNTKFFNVESDTINMRYDAWDHLLLGEDGVFWLIKKGDAIYSYDPYLHKIKIHTELDAKNIYSATISSDGRIFYTVLQNNSPLASWNIMIFNPYSNKITPVELSYSVLENPYVYPSNVFLDQMDQLWLGGLGWRDVNNLWHRLFPSPIFITKGSDSSVWYWENPTLLMQSSDSRYWFQSSNGMAWLDLKQEKWCWFTTFQSNIVEDSEHNLWMIADNKLYKLPLGEK